MRHNKAVNHLGRKSGHRKALLANMASSLILHKRIITTCPLQLTALSTEKTEFSCIDDLIKGLYKTSRPR